MRWNDRGCDLEQMRGEKRMLFFFPDELMRDSAERAFGEWGKLWFPVRADRRRRRESCRRKRSD